MLRFFQVFLIGKFHYTQSGIGDFFAYMGLWIVFAQGGVLRPLSRKFSPAKILTYFMDGQSNDNSFLMSLGLGISLISYSANASVM